MLTRTTLRIEQDLYTRIKKLAIDVHKDVQDIVNEALIVYLPLLQKKLQSTKRQKAVKFSAYRLGFKGGTRREIYENR